MIRLPYRAIFILVILAAKKYTMYLERPSTILKILNNLRWTDKFICLKCGNTKSIKGDDIYDKKCSKCKKNVSLTKYTAFEGLRFPIEKAYGILETLIERAELDSEAKVIKWYNRKHSGRQGYDLVDNPEEFRDPKYISDEHEYLSLIDIINRSNEREEKALKRINKINSKEGADSYENQGNPSLTVEIKVDKEKEKRLNELIEEIIDRWRPTIGSLSKKFEVEENTVVKFLEKISNRIRMEYVGEPENPLHHLIGYINNYRPGKWNKISVKYFLGLAMVPMVGEWKIGATKINGNMYGIGMVEDEDGNSNGEWCVYRMTGSQDGYQYNFELHERIEYGTQEWYDLFHVDTDKERAS